MKSAHRHELQTNALAQRLDVLIQRLRPYVSTVAGVVLAIAVLMLIWSYVSRSSATRHGAAWNAFNQAVGSAPPNLEELHRSAQEYPGTKMQEMADITWADGQVFMASENYIYNRRASKEALDRATSAYQGILQTSSDKRLLNRSHLGLARVYEMRNELEKARDEYAKVGGGYVEFAKQQAERLAKPEAAETYAWLGKAEPPRLLPPTGPGTPGRRPAFSAGDLSLPNASPEAGAPAPSATDPAASFEDLLKGLRDLPSESATRYDAGEQTPPAEAGAPGANESAPATNETAPATDGTPATTQDSPPANDNKSAAEGSAPPAAEEKAAE
ncbi:MAG: hypothetical protein L0228_13910 [Planctomycetes bacterium]|nr:hypothetical protein [Planctomycetota bacterium]